jgi:hypothetical protein
MKINKNAEFPQDMEFTQEYNSIWNPKCGAVSERHTKCFIEGKDLDDNVEANESTCDTWPASGGGTSEHIERDCDDSAAGERTRCHAAAGCYHYFGPSHDWQVVGDQR